MKRRILSVLTQSSAPSACFAFRRTIAGLITVLLLVPGLCLAASFDCTNATTSVEKLICADHGLSQLDEKLSEVYQQVLRSAPDPGGLETEQSEWVREVRDLCTDSVCLAKVYSDRLAVLEKRLLTVPEEFLGKWIAFSRGIQAVYGDLEVKKDSLSFEQLGSHGFVIMAVFDDSVVLEMSESYYSFALS